uniref:BTP domain-containing protein n=1 Tax=Heterorhabditis bacteriophora TaxID=37862 RepID=A0A1I7XME0_HETBA
MARNGLRAATGHILENVGFASISEDSLNLLTDVMRRFMVELWSKGKFYAEHAGRTNIIPDDMTIAFRRLQFSSIEMHDYLQQIGNTGYVKPTCRFPFMKPNIRALYAPQPSEKELESIVDVEGFSTVYLFETRPEHIPRHFPAAHPEWTSEGIRSSANISSQKLQNNNIDLLTNTSPKKKVKPTGSYKDRSSYTPSPAPSPLPPLFIKRPDTTLSRAAIPPGCTDSLAGDISNISPMPKLERNFEYGDSSRPNTPRVCDGDSTTVYNPSASSETSSLPYETAVTTPPYIKDDVIAANIALFTTIKEEARKEKKHKEKKHKDKNKLKQKQEEQKILSEKQVHQLAEEERMRLIEIARDAPTPPMRQEVVQESPKHLKIVISNPHSDSASSAFSPPTTTQPTDDDSDTTPFFDDASHSVNGPLVTTFPLDLSVEDRSLHKKKNKKKDKDRDRSPHGSKDKIRDKERKKKKKKERGEKSEMDGKQKHESVHTPKEGILCRLIRNRVFSRTILSLSYIHCFQLKAPPPLFSSSNDFIKQSKNDRKEKGKKKDEDRKRDKEERKRKEKEHRELEKERAKVVEHEKEKEREKDNEKQREREKEREKGIEQERELQWEHEKVVHLPPPITAFVKAEKRKEKKNKEKRRSKMEKRESEDKNKLTEIEKDDEAEDEIPEVWICPSCSVAWTEGATMVCCDMCDNWFHW